MSAARAAFACLFALTTLTPVFAGPPALVDDLNPGAAYREGPQAQDFMAFRGQAVFTAFESGRGRTLWASDGTPAGTRRLAEGLDAVTAILGEASGGLIVAAASDFQHRPSLWRVDLAGRAVRLVPEGVEAFSRQLVAFAGGQYFFASPAPGQAKYHYPSSPLSLWRTDGTPEGTREIAPLGAADFTAGPLVFRGRLVFLLGLRGEDEPETYLTLWASDGRSAAGTAKLAELESASLEIFLLPAGRRLLFPAKTRRGDELWGTDGTAAGTFALTDFPAEEPFSSGYPRPLAAAGRLYFLADDGEHGRELWASDGTGRGTLRLTDFAGTDPFAFDEHGSVALAAAGPGALFAADDGAHGLELWRSAGSPESTALVADVCPGSCSGFVQPGLSESGKLFFAGREPGTGIEPWASDGTAAGTVVLADLCAGACDANLSFVEVGGEVAILDQTEDFHFALYSTDGSPEGTGLLLEADLGLSLTFPQPFVKLGRRLLFFGGDGTGSDELWLATVPRGGVVPVTDITKDQAAGSDPVDLTAAGGELFFVACDGARAQLYATAGAGASRLLDLGNDCVNFFNPLTDDRLLSAVGGRAFLAYLDLWVSDGTPEGTVNLTQFEFIPTAFPIVVSNVADLGGLAAFLVLERVDGAGGYHERLWLSDGTPEGTHPTDALPRPLRVFELFSLRGRLYFWGWDAEGPGFWSSDGTAAGTHLLHRLPSFRQPPEEAPVDALGAVYFTTSEPQFTLGLWRTDGTPQGTEEAPLRPQLLFGQPAQGLAAMGGALYFVAALGQEGERELWRTDGTAAGTVRLGPIGLDSFDQLVGPVAAGGKLFLLGTDSELSQLWVSDGTIEGTRPLGPPLGPVYYSGELVAAGGKVFFSIVDPERGWELWESDGTEAGTHLAADIAPGRFSSEPRELTVAGQGLYFTADDGIFGREPWLLPATPGCEPSAFALCLAGDRVQATLAWRDAGGIPRRAAARALAADSGGFSFVDPASLEVVAKALDATALNGKLWAFAGSLSGASWELTLRDGATGGARRWVNLLHQQTAVADFRAFPAAGLPSADEAVRVLEKSGPALAGRREPTLAPALTPAPSCQPAPGVLCLHGGRFRVEVGRQGAPLTATVLPWSDLAGAFALAPGVNADLAVKVLDGTGVNGRFWVFGTALTHRACTVTVTDTVTGTQRSYAKPEGALQGFTDLGSF